MKKGTLAVTFLILSGAVILAPAFADTVYTNTTAYSYQSPLGSVPISPGFEAADSFTIAGNHQVGGAVFGLWLLSGDSLQSVDWAITTDPGGVALYSDTATNMMTSTLLSGSFDLVAETFAFGNLLLPDGTYYLQLGNAISAGGLGLWDFSGGNSTAFQTVSADQGNYPVGAIGYSQTFNILSDVEGGVEDEPLPEPPSLLLFASGLLALIGLATRNRLAQKSSGSSSS